MSKRYRWMGGTPGNLGKHRKSGTPPGDLHLVSQMVNAEIAARQHRRSRRMFGSIRDLMANRRNLDV